MKIGLILGLVPTMENYLPLDIIRYLPVIADMTVPEIQNLCLCNRRLQETVCNNREFWIGQAEKWLTTNRNNLAKIPTGDIKRHLHVIQQKNYMGSISYKNMSVRRAYLFGYLGYDKVGKYYLTHPPRESYKLYLHGILAGDCSLEVVGHMQDIESVLEKRSALIDGVIGGNMEIVRGLYEKRALLGLDRHDFEEAFDYVIRSGNVPLFHFFIDTIFLGQDIDYASRLYKTYAIRSPPGWTRMLELQSGKYRQIPFKLYDFPEVTHPEILETLLATPNVPEFYLGYEPESLSEVISSILHDLACDNPTPALIKFYDRLLDAAPDIDYGELLSYTVRERKAEYARLLIPRVSGEAIRKTVDQIQDIETLKTFVDKNGQSLLSKDELDSVIYNNADSDPDIIEKYIHQCDAEEFNDAFVKVVTRSCIYEGSRRSIPCPIKSVLMVYLPHLNNEQRAFGARIAKKTHNPVLREVFLGKD